MSFAKSVYFITRSWADSGSFLTQVPFKPGKVLKHQYFFGFLLALYMVTCYNILVTI